MKKEQNIKMLAIAAIVFAGISLAIAYAAFSQTLTINGTATVKGGQWNIHYVANSVTATPGANSQATDVAADTTVNTNNTNFVFHTNLVKPGDTITYTVTIINEGTINATLSAQPNLTLSTTASGVTASDYVTATAEVSKLTLNANGDTATLTVVVTYNDTITQPVASDFDVTITGSLLYEQA